jgi:hypothetical protein
MSAMSEYVDRKLATMAWMDQETIERLYKARMAGTSQLALAQEFRVNPQTMHQWLLRLGLAGTRRQPQGKDGLSYYDRCACGHVKRRRATQCRVCRDLGRRSPS